MSKSSAANRRELPPGHPIRRRVEAGSAAAHAAMPSIRLSLPSEEEIAGAHAARIEREIIHGPEVAPMSFAPRREINSEQRAVLDYYCRTHRGLVPDAIEALLWSHDAILGLAQGLIEAETGAEVEAFEQELSAYVDAETQRKCDP